MIPRNEKVAGVLLKEIGQILREDLHNPHIGFVTLLRIEVTPDLRTARIYYSVLGSEEEKKTTDIELRNSAKFIKKLVNDRIQLRYAIDLRFYRETSIDESFRLSAIFEKINKQNTQNPPTDAGSAPDGQEKEPSGQ